MGSRLNLYFFPLFFGVIAKVAMVGYHVYFIFFPKRRNCASGAVNGLYHPSIYIIFTLLRPLSNFSSKSSNARPLFFASPTLWFRSRNINMSRDYCRRSRVLTFSRIRVSSNLVSYYCRIFLSIKSNFIFFFFDIRGDFGRNKALSLLATVKILIRIFSTHIVFLFVPF